MIGTATRPSDSADPAQPQRRIAVSGSGRQVLVEISSADRLEIIRQLPSRWQEIVKARERGESLEQIHRWARIDLPPAYECRGRCEAPCLRCYLAEVYAWLETALHDLASRRARLLP